MPSLDSISEWVLANLYLVGAVTGVVLLLVLLILLQVGRRGRSFDEQAGGRGSWPDNERLTDNQDTDVFGETLAAAPMTEPLAPFAYDEPFTDTSDEFASTVVGVDDAAEWAADDSADDAAHDAAHDAAERAAEVAAEVASPSPADDVARDAADDVAEGSDPSPAPGPSQAPPPEPFIPAYVPPAKPLGDHARDIVQGLVKGQGDITTAELRRLDLLRPEKVLEVADELDAKLQGRGNESQRARLAKVRQHAEMLMPPVTDLGVVQTEYGTPASHYGEGGVIESGAAQPEPATAESGVVSEEHGVFEANTFEREGAAPEPGNTLRASEAWDDAVEQSGALERPLDQQPGIAPLFTSMSGPVIGEAVSIGPDETMIQEGEPLGEQAADAVAAEGSTTAAAPEQPEEEDVLGLDQSERVAALNSLTPKELGRLFSATDDKAAKLSIIDTLETMPGVETMSVIQLILDDPDPEVQLRALDAAERLLAQG